MQTLKLRLNVNFCITLWNISSNEKKKNNLQNHFKITIKYRGLVGIISADRVSGFSSTTALVRNPYDFYFLRCTYKNALVIKIADLSVCSRYLNIFNINEKKKNVDVFIF